jgi:hypothetical protein
MTPRSLSNMMVILAVVQIVQAIATAWLAVEVAAVRHEMELQASR